MSNEQVVCMLKNSISMDPGTRSVALDQLGLLEQDPHFLIMSLLDIRSMDEETQFLSLCCCRNVISRLYVKIQDHEKIKCVLIELLISVPQHLLEMVIEIINKIIRVSSLSEWRSLIDYIIDWGSKLASLTQYHLDRYSYILYHVVKEQEKKRLVMAQRKETAEIFSALSPVIIPQWILTLNRSTRYLDGAIIRIAKQGKALTRETLILFLKKMSIVTDMLQLNKLWKELSLLSEKDLSVIETDFLINLSISAIEKSQGREYPVTVLREINTALSPSLIDLLVNRFLLLSISDVAEWAESPEDSSLGGPLDGDLGRQAVDMFLISQATPSIVQLAISRIEKCINDLQMDAWIHVLLTCNECLRDDIEARIVSPLIRATMTDNSGTRSPVVQFRVIQLVRVLAPRLSRPFIRELVIRFSSILLIPNQLSEIKLSLFFTLKSLFDRSFDDDVWLHAGPVMVQSAMELLPRVHAADVVWRILNAIALVLSETRIKLNSADVLVRIFSTSKDLLVRSAIFDILKAGLVSSGQSIVHSSLAIVANALSGLARGQQQIETFEILFCGSMGVLTSVIRVVESVDSEVGTIVESVITQTLSGWRENISHLLPKELIECLIEFDALCIDNNTRIDTNGQAEICKMFLTDPDSDAVVDEVMVLLELLVAMGGEASDIGWLTQLVSSLIKTEDNDSIFQLITTMAAVAPGILLAVVSKSPTIHMSDLLWQRILSAKLGRTKLRLVNALTVVAPSKSADLKQRLFRIVTAIEYEDEEVLRVSSKMMRSMRSNRYECRPEPIRRVKVLNAVRNVDAACLRGRIASFSHFS